MDLNLDEKTRRAFEEGLEHMRIAHMWKDEQDEQIKTREVKNAIKSFEYVVSKAPEFDRGWVEMAQAYLELHDYDLAKFLLNKALTHTPRSIIALSTMGHLLEKLGLLAEAARVYSRAHRIDSNAGFDKKQQQALERVIEHKGGVPKLPDTEALLHQILSTSFAWNGTEVTHATITLTRQRILCIGKKASDQGMRPKRLKRKLPPSWRGPDYKEASNLQAIVPLATIEHVHKVRFGSRIAIHVWDRDENHLVFPDLLETDIEAILSFLGERQIEIGEIKAKLCSILFLMFISSLLLSLFLFL
ncbi:MAG: hypothetical protein ACE5I5_09155 [Candidatus Heimdallarchaeota archaeon]